MRRTKALRLVLLGGGVAVMLASCGDNDSRARECEKARAEMRPDAEQICRRSTTRSSTGSSWFFGRSGAGSTGAIGTPSSTSSSRSGFGSSARSSGGG